MAEPLLRGGQYSSGCTLSLCEALKTNPRHAGATDSGWSSMCSSHAGIGGAKEGAGAIRSAGWRESVTVTWLPTTTPERRPRCCTALATTFDTIAPSIAELTAATARLSLECQHRTPAPHTHG